MNLFYSLLFMMFFVPNVAWAVLCYPHVDPHQKQYIIGYGSLINQESRHYTFPSEHNAYPIELQGFRRGWIAHGDEVGFSTTFLGITKDPQSTINAIYFSIVDDVIQSFDERERGYCRVLIPHNHIKPYEGKLNKGQYWIYVNKNINKPNKTFPIVQSYVDLFLSGCMEIEEKYGLHGFARKCVNTTRDWSEYWVNDRIFPRRPYIYQPRAFEIDHLLLETVGNVFEKIIIE